MLLDNETRKFISGEKFQPSLVVKVNQKESVKYRIDIIENLVKNKNVIHLGCTDHVPLIEEKIKKGNWLHANLTKICNNCLGIDINEEGINFIKNNFNYENVIHGDITQGNIIQITNKKWDYLVMGEVLEHIDNSVMFLKKIISNYGDYIKNIIITVPNAFCAGNFMHMFLNNENINSDHMYWFSPYTLWKVIEKSGLELEILELCQLEMNKISLLRRMILKKYPLLNNDILAVCKIKNDSY